MIHLLALSMPPHVRTWLQNGGQARVLSVHDQACNLRAPGGELLALVSDRRAAGPFSLVVSWDPEHAQGGFSRWVAPGDPVDVAEGILDLGPLQVDTRQAQPWDPRPDWEQVRARRSTWKALIPGLIAPVRKEAPPDSLMNYLPPKVENHEPGPRFSNHRALNDRLISTILRHSRALQAGLGCGDWQIVETASAGLAGLGSGLTPAGDDYLAGVMLALWASRSESEAVLWCEHMAASATPRTTALSAAWLRFAARGEAGAVWHPALEAMAIADAGALAAAVRAILLYGHTSGGDGLAGFLETLTN